ncbi:putative homeodomain transcription factor isoform X1 [Rhagoletis pomonella]|uniref:putative homeodomain transcription factor isoform X1 n=2 Tax=Rhagoletis pomonella TaxID=28610 RepID=UPI00177FFE2C|nr:putative homeodomain transcription factor isoform X1 [Rhagoletis pomonella]
MKLDEIVAWYQKKIGTYDKQQWEKTVEQKILDGFNSVTLKNAKLKTDLIDVDLVRGSTFPKAKPKQSLLTVIRLAILRYFFLPVFARWWVKQTSPNTFGVLLLMYITQMVTWAVYTFNVHRFGADSGMVSSMMDTNTTRGNATAAAVDDMKKRLEEEHVVSLSDLIIPMVLGLLLSFIHSQIVATNTLSGAKSKHRRFSNASQSGKAARQSGESRVRRRKKLMRVRSQESTDASTQPQQPISQQQTPVNCQPATSQNSQQTRLLSAMQRMQANTEKLPKITNATIGSSAAEVICAAGMPKKRLPVLPKSSANAARVGSAETFSNTTTTTTGIRRSASPVKLKLDLKAAATTSAKAAADCSSTDCNTDNYSPTSSHSLANKKRNVNWHSPIHNYAMTSSDVATVTARTQEKQQQTSPQSLSSPSGSASASAGTTTTTSETNSPNTERGNAATAHNAEDASADCGGGSTTTSSANGSPNNKTVRIDTCIQEFYDDLISRTDRLISDQRKERALGEGAAVAAAAEYSSDCAAAAESPRSPRRRQICEDDGFESLNGKSSSGEEMNMALPPAYAVMPELVEESKLRLRLNAGNKVERVEDTSSYEGEQTKTSSYYRLKSMNDKSRPVSACDSHQATRKLNAATGADVSSGDTDEEGDDGENVSSPASLGNASNYTECTTSATEWLGVTTNSEECSYSSELENSDDYKNHQFSDEDGYDGDFMPTTILNAHGTSDRISCTVWEQREVKKAQMSVLEISSCIIERVESMPETNDYIYIGLVFSFLLSLVPSFCRLCEVTIDSTSTNEINYLEVPMLLWQKASFSSWAIFGFAFGHTKWERTVLMISFLQRLCLTTILFIVFAVAERTFKQRFLYAKLFSHLTSSRRARKSNLPHFRLNKVRNIKTWLSVRSYLKKRGPQRSVDVIVSAAFIVTLLLLAFLSVEWLKDSVHLHSHLNLEALMWSTTIGIFLVRFMTLGNKIHHKYRSVSVLITEQINLYLQIEQKPKKKDELMVSNSVLKLAADLLKELESPFKISGLSANPYLFTTVKVVILSALSGVLSEMLGFKLKLHKIKIK